MTIIAILLAIAFVVTSIAAQNYRNRAENLEIQLADERDANLELHAARLADWLDMLDLRYQLDDVRRERDRWRDLHSELVRENSTLCVDLMRTQERNVYLESIHTARKSEKAGIILTELVHVVNPNRKMRAWKVGAP